MISAIITDFDGTLVDTFEANLCAYQKAFAEVGLSLTSEKYRQCFGYRFDRFMNEMSVSDMSVAETIRENKMRVYSDFFDLIKLNTVLFSFISCFHRAGGKTAIASTARKENLLNVINYLGISEHFDFVCAGEDVENGKPSPEIYLKATERLGVLPSETLIFEDSKIGFLAAESSGANCFSITTDWFE